jgi:hypothetical protein
MKLELNDGQIQILATALNRLMNDVQISILTIQNQLKEQMPKPEVKKETDNA